MTRVFLEQIQENNCSGFSLLSLKDENATCFLVKFAKFFRKPFFYRTPPMATFETKNIHASAANLLHIRIERLD